jgi:hypothetical protein
MTDLSPLYYMRDNHTFKRLSDDPLLALAQVEECLNDGFTSGMLCTKRKTAIKDLHANGEKHRAAFMVQAREWLQQHAREQDPPAKE